MIFLQQQCNNMCFILFKQTMHWHHSSLSNTFRDEQENATNRCLLQMNRVRTWTNFPNGNYIVLQLNECYSANLLHRLKQDVQRHDEYAPTLKNSLVQLLYFFSVELFACGAWYSIHQVLDLPALCRPCFLKCGQCGKHYSHLSNYDEARLPAVREW